MNKENLIYQINIKKSFLCVGLDSDISKIPNHLLSFEDPLFEFNKQIIDATKDLCVAYKLNTAFYESNGLEGWKSLMKTIEYIPNDLFTIADAKRGDIGNTSEMYAKTFFESMDFDSITVNPFMGSDSVQPFLNFNKKWGSDQNMMYVVGATQAISLLEIRKLIPNHFILVPGLGAQGGNLKDIAKFGMNNECGLLVNSSRSIIYSSNGSDFAQAARASALKIKLEMEGLLN